MGWDSLFESFDISLMVWISSSGVISWTGGDIKSSFRAFLCDPCHWVSWCVQSLYIESNFSNCSPCLVANILSFLSFLKSWEILFMFVCKTLVPIVAIMDSKSRISTISWNVIFAIIEWVKSTCLLAVSKIFSWVNQMSL